MWATNILKNYLIKGYALNEKQLSEKRLINLEKTIELIKKNISTSQITSKEAIRFFDLIIQYSLTWRWIEEYDSGRIAPLSSGKERKKVELSEAKKAISKLKDYLIEKGLASDLFGKELSPGLLLSALNNIFQQKKLYFLYREFKKINKHISLCGICLSGGYIGK